MKTYILRDSQSVEPQSPIRHDPATTTSPAVGKRVAAHIIEPKTPIEPRFSLATKATQQNRTVY